MESRSCPVATMANEAPAASKARPACAALRKREPRVVFGLFLLLGGAKGVPDFTWSH